IPDAWLLFQRLSDGVGCPVLLEIDRATEFQERFKNHIKARIEFIRSGDYARIFDTKAVIIAYATAGQVQEHRETRRRTMATWTQEVLAELKLNGWEGIFRFTSVDFDTLYQDAQALFEQPVWYRPDQERPVRLFG